MGYSQGWSQGPPTGACWGAQADESLIMKEEAHMVAHEGLVSRTCHRDWLEA